MTLDELRRLHPQLTEKAIVDYVNGLEVLNDHLRFHDQTNNEFLTRIWDSITGRTAQREQIIDGNITNSLKTVSVWLQDIQLHQGESDIAVTRLAGKLKETRTGVMRLQERHNELAKDVQVIAHHVDRLQIQVQEHWIELESKIRQVNAGRLASTHLEQVFDKWQAERLNNYPPLARFYIVIDELYWGYFGTYCRSQFGISEVHELMEQLRNKGWTQIKQDLGGDVSQLMLPEEWLSPIQELPKELREVLIYLSNWADLQTAPVTWAIRNAALLKSGLPHDFPRVFSGEHVINHLMYENKKRIQFNNKPFT
ncbi:diguanylate cyclase regulator RdcB family protein [uncultured Nostoc sp.]|uniref:diguanylate cyclase regulator RdcB family protein n=1 Tax=uncultured Nostoc sp. TaxID=340711 RepID=UPI0035C9D8C8